MVGIFWRGLYFDCLYDGLLQFFGVVDSPLIVFFNLAATTKLNHEQILYLSHYYTHTIEEFENEKKKPFHHLKMKTYTLIKL